MELQADTVLSTAILKCLFFFYTHTKPDVKDSNHESDAKSQTSETTAIEVGQMTLPSPDPKTYSHKDFENFKEKLEEDFRYKFQIDKTILEKEIKNQFMFQIETLNFEHQNQLTKIQADIEAQIQMQAKKNEQKAQDDHTIKCSNKESKHLKQEQV